MVYESGLILLMLGSFIFMYFFLDYFKLRFIEFLNTKKDFNNKKRTIMTKLVEEMDLLFIIHMFISILFFTNLFLQTTSEAQNTILSGWFSFIILEFTPFILLIIINFVLRFIEVIRDTDDD